MANSDEVRGEQAATSDDSRYRRLNTLLSSQSYLFSHVPTHLDDLVASKVGRLQQEQVQEHPHLARWSRHISSFRYVLHTIWPLPLVIFVSVPVLLNFTKVLALTGFLFLA